MYKAIASSGRFVPSSVVYDPCEHSSCLILLNKLALLETNLLSCDLSLFNKLGKYFFFPSLLNKQNIFRSLLNQEANQ